MHNPEELRSDVPLPLASVATGTTAGEAKEFVERRRPATPLVFESVERRQANLREAGVDLLAETMRVQEAAILEGLRHQVRGIPAQLEAARAEARAACHAEMLAGIDAERAAMVDACLRFSGERERYFSGVEGEVVRLALAIAARVLHREAQLDPMLLAASVRLALEKVAGETGTVLRVPLNTAEGWRKLLGPEAPVQVIGDERLGTRECVMETSVGRVELGVGVQLEEIEKGFFDLLQKRPA